MTRPARLKALSLLLILSLLLHCFPALPVAAEETAPSDTALPATEPAQPLTEQCRILDHVDADVFASGNHVARLPEEEQLYSYVFQNADGSKTVYYMDQAVKFVDANGIVQEKNLTLTAVASDLTPNAMGITPTAGYTTACNDVGLYLPLSPADGIRLSYGAQNVTVIPQGGDSGVTASVDGSSIVYRDYYGPGMSLVYTPSLSGVKEDIVLSAYTGVTEFTFTLRTNGLNLYQANGRYFLAASKTATERFDLGDVVAFDANGRFSVGSMTVQTVMPGQAYAITLSVSEEYLTAPDTVYPVRIDPTIEISDNLTGSDAILDASIYQLMPNTNANWPFMHCGYYSTAYGIGRIMVQLPGLLSDSQYFPLSYDRIQSATFYIKEATGKAAHTIQLRAHTGNSWTESGATWNSVGSSLGPVYATASVGPNSVAEFDITDLIIDWIEGMQNSSKGFVLTHSDENNATKGFCSSEYTTTGYRPYVRVDFTDTTASSLNKSVAELDPGDTEQLVYSGVTGTVTWFSDNPDVATVSSTGVVTALRPGTAVIIASAPGYTARRCTVYVSFNDGIYKFFSDLFGGYLSLDSLNTDDTADVVANAYSLTDTKDLTEYWQVVYHGAGCYTLHPWNNTEAILKVDPNHSKAIVTIHEDDNSYDNKSLWKIEYSNGWYLLRSAYNSYLLNPSDGYDHLVLEPYDDANDYQYWDLWTASAPNAIVIYSTDGKYLTSTYEADSPTIYTGLVGAQTTSELGIFVRVCDTQNTSQAVTWTSSNSMTATIIYGSGVVTPHAMGETVITVGRAINGNLHQVQFNLSVLRTLYLRNYYDESFPADTAHLSYINDAVEFARNVYISNFEIYLATANAPEYFENPAFDCENGMNAPCNEDDCGDNCLNHHKNLEHLSNIFYEYARPENYIDIFWGDASGIYCKDSIDHTSASQPVTSYAVVYYHRPVAHMFDIPAFDTQSEPTDDYVRVHMSIALTHELAHCFGMNDVYTNPVEQPDGHDKANTYQCIMEYYEENAIMAYYNAVRNQPGLAFCQSCKATLSTCAENQYFLGNID